MNTFKAITIIGLLLGFTTDAFSQLPDGSIAPDFTITDTDGVEHHLYDYLDQGKKVLICFGATWNGPGWTYLNSNAANDLHNTYGPEGTDEYVVLLIETDPETTLEDLQGTGDNTTGDWLSAADFPIADNGSAVSELYEIAYYPAVIGICPSGFLRNTGQVTALEIYSGQGEFCCDGTITNDARLLQIPSNITADCEGEVIDIRLQNNGTNELTSCSFEVHQSGELIHTADWTGSLSSCEHEQVLFEGLDLSDENLLVTLIYEDDVPSNNSIVLESEVVTNSTTSHLRLSVLTDSYPEESSWYVTDEDGNIILESEPYLQPETWYFTDIFLPEEGCYFFHFLDAYGDGLFGGQWGEEFMNGDIMLTSIDEFGIESDSYIDYQTTNFEVITRIFGNVQQVPIMRSGMVFNDTNENGIFDTEESGIPGIVVNHNGQSTVTSDLGVYFFTDFEDEAVLSISPDIESWPTNTTASELNLLSTSNYYNSFGLSSNDPNFGADINYAQSGIFLCEQEVGITLSITNTGNSLIDAEVSFLLDELFTYVEAFPSLTSQEGQNLIWNLEDIPAGSTTYMTIYVIAPNWEAMGDELSNTVILTVFDQEGNIQDTDTQLENDVLFCSYDPNDKQVFPEGITENHYVPSGTRLEYFVRFQNTGNYYATDVTVTDPISDLLDLSTFELVSTSHYCLPSINFETREIDLHFPNIMLPDSTTNEPGSHGSITFLIDHVEGVSQPAAIENTAYIYFDSNPAVITNTTLTTIDDLNSIFETPGSLPISVYPIPSRNKLTIDTPTALETTVLIVKDALGRDVMTKANHQTQSYLDISNLSNGVYLLEWRTIDNELLSTLRFMKE